MLYIKLSLSSLLPVKFPINCFDGNILKKLLYETFICNIFGNVMRKKYLFKFPLKSLLIFLFKSTELSGSSFYVYDIS